MLKKYVIVGSFSELIYSLYLYRRLKQKKVQVELIFLHIDIAIKSKPILLKQNIKYHIFKSKLPAISIFSSFNGFFKFMFFPLRIFTFIKKIRKFRKKFSKNIVLYTQGNHVAFASIFFLKYFNAKKIISIDGDAHKKELNSRDFSIGQRYFSNLNRTKLSTMVHFFLNNFFSGSMCKYWHNGFFYRYFKYKKFNNEIELNDNFYNNKRFKFFFQNLVPKTSKKNSIIFLLTEVFDIEKDLKVFSNFLFLIRKKKCHLLLKFHPDTSLYLKKKNFRLFKT